MVHAHSTFETPSRPSLHLLRLRVLVAPAPLLEFHCLQFLALEPSRSHYQNRYLTTLEGNSLEVWLWLWFQ